MSEERALTTRGCQATVANGPRKGQPCGNPTIDGYPYCRNHMNLIGTSRGAARYAHKMPPQLREEFLQLLEESNPKSLYPEIANVRTTIGHLLEQASALDEEGRLTLSKKDLEFIYMGTKLVGELVERQAKVNPDKYIPVESVMRIISDIVDIVRTNLPPDFPAIREKIAAEIQKYCMNQVVNKTEGLQDGATKPGNI